MSSIEERLQVLERRAKSRSRMIAGVGLVFCICVIGTSLRVPALADDDAVQGVIKARGLDIYSPDGRLVVSTGYNVKNGEAFIQINSDDEKTTSAIRLAARNDQSTLVMGGRGGFIIATNAKDQATQKLSIVGTHDGDTIDYRWGDRD